MFWGKGYGTNYDAIQSKWPIAKKIKINFCALDAPQLIELINMIHKKIPNLLLINEAKNGHEKSFKMKILFKQ
jgi:hypothetical protein